LLHGSRVPETRCSVAVVLLKVCEVLCASGCIIFLDELIVNLLLCCHVLSAHLPLAVVQLFKACEALSGCIMFPKFVQLAFLFAAWFTRT
jgi:hypothetical protein